MTNLMAVTLKGPDLSSCLITAAAWATAAPMRIAPSCETKRSCLPNSRGTAYLKTMSSSHSINVNEQFLFPRVIFNCCVSNVCFALPFTLLYNYSKYRWPQLMLICCLLSCSVWPSTHWSQNSIVLQLQELGVSPHTAVQTLTKPKCT